MLSKCYVFLFHKAGASIRGAKYNLDEGVVYFRPKRFSKKQAAVIPEQEGEYAKPYKRGRFLFLVNQERNICLSWNGNIIITPAAAAKICEKLKLLNRSKFLKWIGSREATLIETLVYLAAGYGILRLVEYALMVMYA
jgi:hypothetical protein